MKRTLWALLAGAVAITAGVSLIALPRNVQWTSSSAEAVTAFEAAIEAADKLYFRDVVEHCERALELDPDFVAAKIQLASTLADFDKERANALRDEVINADLDKLNPRERLMVERIKAYKNKDSKQAATLLDAYLEDYPDDPYAVSLKATLLFHNRDLEEAERMYNRIVEINPNAVLPYNQLGYIAMQMGRFAEAEEHFTSYRFIAPDQANPHDSLGELFVILGRYDDAIDSFTRAIEIKDDFWNSHIHLMVVHILRKDFVAAQEALDRAEQTGALPDQSIEALRCTTDSWRLLTQRAWDEMIEAFEADTSCASNPMSMDETITTVHRAACAAGRFDLATSLEEKVEQWTEKKVSKSSKIVSSQLLHMQAVHLAHLGKLNEAEGMFREIDGHTSYKNADEGLFKLYNRLMLVEVLLARNHQADAYALLSQVRLVNPTMAADFERDELQILGLRRS